MTYQPPVPEPIPKGKAKCSACQKLSAQDAKYCDHCNTPMADITTILDLVEENSVDVLSTWRIYGIDTPIVGRARELEQLSYWHQNAIEQGITRTIRVLAPTGMGKSRLLAEFRHSLERKFSETVFLQAACRERTGNPYEVFSRLLRSRFYISNNDSEANVQRKFQDAIFAIMDAEQAPRVCHLVGYLLGISFQNSEFVPDIVDQNNALQLQQNCFESLLELLRSDAQRNPLILAIRDLQYATPHTLQLLTYLTQHLGNSAVLFILSWDQTATSTQHPLYNIPVVHAIELLPLSDQEVEQFIRETLNKVETIPSLLIQKVIESAHGHPLAVEEIIRILMSDNIVDTRQTPWQIDQIRLQTIELPQTVEGSVQKRLLALTHDERLVLEMAACIGRFFWPQLVRCLYNLRLDEQHSSRVYWTDTSPDHSIDGIIQSLERKDMIRRHENSWIGGIDEYQFKHQLECKSVYAAISPHHKAIYHRLIAQWLERQTSAQPNRIAEVIAEHYSNARCNEQAAQHYTLAADIARSHYANEKAVDLYTRALDHLNDGQINLKLHIFHDLGSVYDLLGHHEDARECFENMLRVAWILNDANKGGVAFNKIGRSYRSLGNYDDALFYLQKSLELFQHADDRRGIASTMDDIGKIHWIRGHYEDAQKYLLHALELRRETNDHRSIALSLNRFGALLLQRGDSVQAMQYFTESMTLRKSINDRQGLADSFNTLGALCAERGEYDEAQTLFQEALHIAKSIGYRTLEGGALNNIGELFLRQNDTAAAKTYLDDAYNVAKSTGDRRSLFDIYRNLGRLALKESRREEALKHAQKACRLADELNSKILTAVAFQSIADVHAHYIFDFELRDASIKTAEKYYQQALSILREINHDSQLAQCLLNYGSFLLELGEFSEGHDSLETALAIFDRLHMVKFQKTTRAMIDELQDFVEVDDL